jgi:tetratricopeptide (TPR) repeat protein
VRRALLIGSEVGGLSGVHRDVAVMDEVLQGHGFTTVRVTGREATADGIVAHYRGLAADTADGDAAVVYYAGHGGRVRNPEPGLPRWLQFVVPTDFHDRSGNRARCVLAEELSRLQLELTARTPNVTTILDCCHSARMSRDATLIPRAVDGFGLPTADLLRRWREQRAGWPDTAGIDSNPHAVRVVACSADESAYEVSDTTLDGREHGALTAALVPVLGSAEASTLTWTDVLGIVRGTMPAVAPQRPEVEGPADRLVFSTERRSTVGVRPVRTEGGRFLLDGAALFGTVSGDTYAVVPPGGDPAAPAARATVERVTDGRAVLRLDPPLTALPPGAMAWPLEVALGARPVAVLPADDPRRPEVAAALTRTAQVRVVDDPSGALATVRLDGAGVQVLDAAGAPLYGTAADRPPIAVAEAVRRLARAAHVRELGSGTGPEELPDDVEVGWVRLLPEGGEKPLTGGEHLFVGDRLLARFTNTGTEQRFVSSVDVGLSGALTVLTTAEPDGMTLDPGQLYELGRDWPGSAGIAVGWPSGLPQDGPRAESVVTIVADARIDGLRALAQDGVAQRGHRTSLGRLLTDLAAGRRELILPDPASRPVRYRVRRFDFVLHPTPRPDTHPEPVFEVDERPDPSYRLVVPRGIEPPRRVAVRLKELTVHRNRAFLASRVRVDALVITAAPAGSGTPFQAGTARFERVRDGDRLPFDDLLVYEGPAGRFLDLAVWVTRDDSPDLDLAALLAAETATPEVASAVTTLAGLAVAAPAAALVAGSAAAVAVLVRTAARVLAKASGSSIGVYRTSLLPHERFGAGAGIGRHPANGVIQAQDMSFAFEVIDLDAVEVGDGTEAVDEQVVQDDEDEGDDEAWELAEEFDRRAREPGRPDPDLLDALAGVVDDEVLMTLFSEFATVCAGEGRDAGDRYAEHLLALAVRLGDDDARAVRAVVDVTTAELYLRAGDRAEAERRARRCGPDLAELLPGLLGDREYLLGWLADEEGRTGDAHDHAAAARDLFAEHERWDEAAYSAEAAAQTHATMTREALDDWRRAVDLNIAAGKPDEARRCVEHAGERLAQTMAEPGAGDGPATAALCAAVRGLASAHGLPVLAARLDLAEAMCASDADVPWPDVVSRHEESRRAVAALDLDPVPQRGELARVDLALGRAAAMQGRASDAERLLSAALPALREAGLDGEAQMCEGMLLALGAALHPESVGGPLAADRFTDPDVRAGLLMTDGLQLARQGRFDEALERLAASAAVDGAAGGPLRQVMTDAVTAAVRAGAGDGSAVPEALARVEDQLADGALPHSARVALTQAADLLRGLPERPTAGGPGPQIDDVDAALAELRGLPADAPGRPERAAALVEALVRGDPMEDPRRLRPLDELLAIADAAVAETPRWVRTRTAGRLLSLMRALAERELPDPDVAIPRLDALAAEAGDDPALAPLVRAARWSVQVAQSVHHGDTGAVTRLRDEVATFLDRMPQGDPRVKQLRESMLAGLDLFGANERGDDLGDQLLRMQQVAEQLPPGDLRTSALEALATAFSIQGTSADGGNDRVDDERLRQLQDQAERSGLGDADRAVAHAAVAAAALRGGQETGLDRIDLGITHLRRALEIGGPQDPQRVFHLAGLALGLFRRSELTGSTAGLREAETLLEEARDAAGGPGHVMWPMVNEMLSDVRRLLGEAPDGHRVGLEGLRGHVWRVLAQPDLEGATVAVRRAATDAVDTARRCLVANDPAAAITALDAGRGLALFAATTVGTFAQRLEEAGDRDLAERWRTAVATGDPAQLPSELRRAVLKAVTAHGSGADLLDPPAFDEIQRALGAIDADALVYLVPGAGVVPGYAVCAPATGAPRYLVLPNLDVGNADLTRYLAAVNGRDLAASTPEPVGAHRDLSPAATRSAVAEAVDRLCGWAWDAAMGPLIESFLPRLPAPPSRRPQRLVLVPMGDLARVPWHAARRPRDRRHAIELVAISQAVSARMLSRSAELPPVPTSRAGLVVGDPDTGMPVPGLDAARREALAIRRTFYPGARYIGRRPDGSTSPSGAGTETEVRAWLTASGPAAGTVLHLACHGFVQAGTDRPTAYLLLAGGQQLFAKQMIEIMAPVERAVGLAVLAACHTGESMTGYDEAYSLGTAFLATGVRSVLSTQWAIPDDETSVLMFMFHHYLHSAKLPAWAALREAQRWMLNADRIVPDDMPRQLGERLAPEKLPEVVAWAAFVHWGQ